MTNSVPSSNRSGRSLAHSASDPGLAGGRQQGSSNLLKSAGSGLLDTGTTNLYDRMQKEGRIRDSSKHIRPCGRSTVVPLADSAARNVQPEIYYPAPPTPLHERRFRKSRIPGEINVHHSLKDQKLPHEDFPLGMRCVRGSTTEDAVKAGQKFGIEEYKMGVAERCYESNVKEPLGKPYIRGHTLKMPEAGFGKSDVIDSDSKMVIFPVDNPKETEEQRLLYRRTHNHFNPGERINREYNWPEESKDEYFRFGAGQRARGPEGEGVRLALSMDVEDDGLYKKTRLVQRVCEDYRNVVRAPLGTKIHQMQGASGPPFPADHAYGIKSTTSDTTARSCILGYYGLPEQLPDRDLGRCVKPGRRNVTSEVRPFGAPSIRTDVPAPAPGRKSIADTVNYGDEPGAAALLNPQRFDEKGVPDSEFLLRRPRDELESLVNAGGYSLEEAAMDFDKIWREARDLFEDDLDLVSLDAFLYIYSRQIDDSVSQRLSVSSPNPEAMPVQ